MQAHNHDAPENGAPFQNDVFPPQDVPVAPPEPEHQQNENGETRPNSRPQARTAGGEDATNRKLFNMPPVVGSFLQYANKTLPYRPFPKDLDEVRKKIFLLEQPVLLDSQQIADYWPHVSNLYMRSSRPAENNNGTVIEAWECRIRRRVTMKGKHGQGQGIRQRQSKDQLLENIDECKVRLNLLSYTKHVESQEACGGPGFGNCQCIADWLYMERTIHTRDERAQHTHPLDLLDAYKRSDALMYFCKLKIEEGQYSYAAVLKWAKEKYGPTSSQLQHLNKADVANVARFWRQQHKDVELRSEVLEETDADRQRRECFDSILTTPADSMRKALTEVCKVYPHAVEIIAPFLQKRPEEEDESKPIPEGYDLLLPPPGRPRNRKRPCDPPSPPNFSAFSADSRRPPPPQPAGSYFPVSQIAHGPSPQQQTYPQPPNGTPNNVVQGFRISLPSPSTPTTSSGPPIVTNQTGGNVVPMVPKPPALPQPPPYPFATPTGRPPVRFQQWPGPNAPHPMAHPGSNQRFTLNGVQPVHDRPSWAKPEPKHNDGTQDPSLAKEQGSIVPAPPVQNTVSDDVEEQLRNELS